MLIISSSVSLLAIIAGMFLYAKTQKDNLSRFLKIVSLFVVIVGFLNFFAVGAYFTMKQCYHFGSYHNKMWNKKNETHKKCGYECMNKRMACHKMAMNDGNSDSYMKDGMPCCGGKMMQAHKNNMMNPSCCEAMKESSCNMMNKNSFSKDSVLLKKK